MLQKFSAQNFEGQSYTALDFNQSSAVASLYYAKNGDITLVKKLFQLLWASTNEDGLSIEYKLNSVPHLLSSTSGRFFLDKDEVKFSDLEKRYLIKFTNYSKTFTITYTQLLNMELARVDPNHYLNKYIFHNPDSKSYYSPIEDVFYDIEQAKKYSGEMVKEETENSIDFNNDRINEIQLRITQLQENKNNNVKSSGNLAEDIKKLESSLNDQKKLDTLLIQKDDISKKLNTLSQKIKQYEEALMKVSEHDGGMAKYNNFIKLNVQRVENDLAMFSYRIREREKVISDMANVRPKNYENAAKFPILAITIAAVVCISFVLTLVILTNVFIALIVGFFLTVICLLYFITSSNKKKNVAIPVSNLDSIRIEIETLKSAKIRYINNLGFNSEDDYFATKALVKALLFQKESDINRIHETFEGKEISDYKHEYEQFKNSLLEIQNSISQLGEPMSPEVYIKKRRELDMMKLEASSNTGNTSTNVDDQIATLNSELEKLQNYGSKADSITKFKEILTEYYGQEIECSKDFISENINVQTYEEKVELLIISRLAYIKAEFPQVELPYILEDPFVGVENKDLIKKILNFCSSKTQTILLSEHEKYTNIGLYTINKVED